MSSRIGKAAAVNSKLNNRIWSDSQPVKRLNSFHLLCLRCLLQIKWQEKVTNTEVLQHLFAFFSQKRLKLLGHVCFMGHGRIPKDMLYGELHKSSCSTERPQLQFKDACKCNIRAADIDSSTWECCADTASS